MNRLLEALQQHRRAANGVRSGFPKQLARVSATLFSQRSAASLSALFNDPPIQKDVRIVFPNTRTRTPANESLR